MHRSQLPIVQPCHESWDDMDGAGSVRHCESCDESVHELSSLSEGEARAFLAEHGAAKPCIRYRIDGAGRILFAVALSVAASGCLQGKMASDTDAPCDPPAQVAEQPLENTAEEPASAEASETESEPVNVDADVATAAPE
jgi:hypothetical protein